MALLNHLWSFYLFCIVAIISQKGSDAWWYMSTEELLPEKYRSDAADYQKGTDTMDVWFDSGMSAMSHVCAYIFFSSSSPLFNLN